MEIVNDNNEKEIAINPQDEIAILKSIIAEKNAKLVEAENEITKLKSKRIDLVSAKNYEGERIDIYNNLINNLDIGILEVDLKNYIVFANSVFCKLTGYNLDELIGKDANLLLIDPKYFLTIRNQIQIRYEGKGSVYELPIRTKLGKELWFIVSGFPLFDNEKKIIGTIGLHLDITDKKKLINELNAALEKNKEASLAKERFLAKISHEIRTPLNAIIGMSDLISSTNLDKQQTFYNDAILSSSQQLLSIVDDILDFSRIKNGNFPLMKTVIKLNEFLRKTLALYEEKTKQKDVQLLLEIDKAVNNEIICDENALFLIFSNLLNNAVKFTEKGSITVRLLVVEDFNFSQLVKIDVIDTGIGIKKEKIDLIFEEFTQSNNKISMAFGGTGLGLAKTKKIVGALDGEIKVESKSNVGSTFTVLLNFEKNNTKNISEAFEILQKSKEKIFGKSILLVEDNEFNAILAESILKRYKLTVTKAVNGIEAIAAMKNQTFDLVLMDILMPEKTGIEATLFIRNVMKNKTPILALTANVFDEEIAICAQIGMDEFITKPFDEKKLINKIEEVLTGFKPMNFLRKKLLTMSEDEKLYDLSQMEAISGGNADFMKNMMSIFITQSREILKDIAENYAAKNYAEVGKLAHKIKPSIAMMGLKNLKNEAKDIEFICLTNSNLENLPELISKLELELTRAINVMDIEIESL